MRDAEFAVFGWLWLCFYLFKILCFGKKCKFSSDRTDSFSMKGQLSFGNYKNLSSQMNLVHRIDTGKQKRFR